MTKFTLTEIVQSANAADFGPAWERLNERQRAFILALLEQGPDVNKTEAARIAGYEGTPGSLRVTAHRLFHNKDVQAVLHGMAVNTLEGAKLAAVSQLAHLAVNAKKESDQLKAIDMITKRVGMPEVTEHHVLTQDVSTTQEALKQELRVLLTRNPDLEVLLPPTLKRWAPETSDAEPIDVEYTIIPPDPDADLGL